MSGGEDVGEGGGGGGGGGGGCVDDEVWTFPLPSPVVVLSIVTSGSALPAGSLHAARLSRSAPPSHRNWVQLQPQPQPNLRVLWKLRF